MSADITTIINAANYENLCDFSVIPPEGKHITKNMFNEDGIIFCKTDFLPYLFSSIQNSNKTYILITHHSDYSIDSKIFSLKPNCIKKWFAINPTFRHPDLIAIPLGVKTHSGIYYEKQYMTPWFASNINSLLKTPKSNNIYCNWNNTNPNRNNIIEKLKTNNLDFTLEHGMPFDEYAKSMASHRFVISPPGNGIDCHRTWESLYLGSVPIVIKDYIYEDWKDLPILQVDDYSEINQDMLENFLKKEFNLEKLYISYWKDRIRNSL